MNALVLVKDGEARTTTLTIAEGMGNPHKSVIQMTRKYQNDLEEFGRVEFEMRPFETAGGVQQREVALLNEHQATLLLTYMRNTDIVRAFKKRLVKAFFDLASKSRIPAGLPDFTNPAIAARAWAEEVEAKNRLQQQVQEQAPKVAALDRIATADGSMCITDAAKHLQIRPKDLFGWLQAKQWIYRRTGGTAWLGYQSRVQQGLLEHKITTVSRPDGTEKVTEQARITAKGLQRLSMELPNDVKDAA